MTIAHRGFVAALSLLLCMSPLSWAQSTDGTYKPLVGQGGKDVVWVPTPQSVVDRMLDMAELSPDDKLVDLGSGDGRTVITAARRGSEARGIEYNPDMVALSRRNAENEGVAERARFEQADIFESDFSEADVVTLFLLPKLNLRLRPTLLDMEPGTRIIANSFTMDDWSPDDSAQVTQNCDSYCYVYKWVVPAKVAGTWTLDGKRLVLSQRFQKLEGALEDGSSSVAISGARLDGTHIRFTVGDQEYVGEVEEDRMRGTLGAGGEWTATLDERVSLAMPET